MMTTRTAFIVRASLILAAIAVWFAPDARAQDGCGRCDHYTFTVAADVACNVTVCWTFSEEGPVFCETVTPGKSFDVPCPVWQATIRTCSGDYVLVPLCIDCPPCTHDLLIGPGCCARICRTVDARGCPVFEISAGDGCADTDC